MAYEKYLLARYEFVCQRYESSKLRNEKLRKDAQSLKTIFKPIDMQRLQLLKYQYMHEMEQGPSNPNKCNGRKPSIRLSISSDEDEEEQPETSTSSTTSDDSKTTDNSSTSPTSPVPTTSPLLPYTHTPLHTLRTLSTAAATNISSSSPLVTTNTLVTSNDTLTNTTTNITLPVATFGTIYSTAISTAVNDKSFKLQLTKTSSKPSLLTTNSITHTNNTFVSDISPVSLQYTTTISTSTLPVTTTGSIISSTLPVTTGGIVSSIPIEKISSSNRDDKNDDTTNDSQSDFWDMNFKTDDTTLLHLPTSNGGNIEELTTPHTQDDEPISLSSNDHHLASVDHTSIGRHIERVLCHINSQIRNDHTLAKLTYNDINATNGQQLNSLLTEYSQSNLQEILNSLDLATLCLFLLKLLAEMVNIYGPPSLDKTITIDENADGWLSVWELLIGHMRLLFQCGKSSQVIANAFSHALNVDNNELLQLIQDECGILDQGRLTGSSDSLPSIPSQNKDTSSLKAYRSLLLSTHHSDISDSLSEDSAVIDLQTKSSFITETNQLASDSVGAPLAKQVTGVDLHNIDKKSLQKRLGLVADDDDDDDNGDGDIVANDASVNVISDNESEFDF